MNKNDLKELLNKVKNEEVTIDTAVEKLKELPFTEIGNYAKIDNHRALRNGYPEVIFCQGKSLDHINGIITKMLAMGENNILATRASKEVYESVCKITDNAIYYDLARIIIIRRKEIIKTENSILVVTGGTADIPVAEEAAITAEVLGNKVERLYDVGVAGIHRLLSKLDVIYSANVIIAAAGMEGAIASVVGGLVDVPVIAVPTSVGYGASFNGVAALLAMLNSCASGTSVVNIDNGFGAGYLASMINKMNGEK
ncbi:nickel pincer cofactor biosynthesis protein LarB [Sedimentibacter sp. MB31-C6]|uniref:nickel pincer cofactor biosynthesis protein LarB n=1 Tax=Sedimentibacter sp. MB31-C6 TaxID=3109366 RepID=UPI002DDCCFA1|nr:nickel pincer cofactor biosynthesis protein LarB [Sedimentibacter sp. MB36-C1]WSI05332.1 nickel pincer cofactor biosynthesis protein LarB [Sedimentibacter sp. MB36-C1]